MAGDSGRLPNRKLARIGQISIKANSPKRRVLSGKNWLPTLDALRRFDWGKLARDLQTVRGILGLEPVYG